MQALDFFLLTIGGNWSSGAGFAKVSLEVVKFFRCEKFLIFRPENFPNFRAKNERRSLKNFSSSKIFRRSCDFAKFFSILDASSRFFLLTLGGNQLLERASRNFRAVMIRFLIQEWSTLGPKSDQKSLSILGADFLKFRREKAPFLTFFGLHFWSDFSAKIVPIFCWIFFSTPQDRWTRLADRDHLAAGAN